MRERLQASIKQLGGKLVGLWYSFGEYDIVSITVFPDNASIAAAAEDCAS